jgi:hypothetical protein
MFSLSDYLVKEHHVVAGLIADYTNDILSELTSIHDFILLSGTLLTIAENLVF